MQLLSSCFEPSSSRCFVITSTCIADHYPLAAPQRGSTWPGGVVLEALIVGVRISSTGIEVPARGEATLQSAQLLYIEERHSVLEWVK